MAKKADRPAVAVTNQNLNDEQSHAHDTLDRLGMSVERLGTYVVICVSCVMQVDTRTGSGIETRTRVHGMLEMRACVFVHHASRWFATRVPGMRVDYCLCARVRSIIDGQEAWVSLTAV